MPEIDAEHALVAANRELMIRTVQKLQATKRGKAGRTQRSSAGDVSAAWRNIPGFLYLNGDVVEEIRQLSGAGGKGTVDELGFQVLYDRIAERLFPWCSTLTSRARYFFFSLAVLDMALQEAVDDILPHHTTFTLSSQWISLNRFADTRGTSRNFKSCGPGCPTIWSAACPFR